MKRFIFLSVVLFLSVFASIGCGKKKEKTKGTEETRIYEKKGQKAETKDLLLTEKEVELFIKACPTFIEICKRHGKKIENWAEAGDKNLFADMRILEEWREYKDEIDRELKGYGFTFESFFETYSKIISSFFYGQMGQSMGMVREEMKKMLENPNIPEEQKQEIRESLKNLEKEEETEETKALRKNWEVVKKYEKEIKKIFEQE
ncbi:MAG: hypothetical protein ABIN61_01065 [candidate division WOR-3 bacterium]